MKISLIGAGNLATQLGCALKEAGHTIIQVYSRTEEAAATLATLLKAEQITSTELVNPEIDLLLFAVKDDALPLLLTQIKPNNAVWAHTAGSVPLTVFDNLDGNYGVFYPLQTFSKNRKVKFEEIPIYLEGNSEKAIRILTDVAQSISQKVIEADSEQRKQLHIAAVFACNFTNRMYAIADDLLKKKGLSFENILPLIDETARKVHELSPKDAQTGPAIRFDEKIIGSHIDLLEEGELKHIYYVLSENIFNSRSKEV